jgi:phage terminase large subunit
MSQHKSHRLKSPPPKPPTPEGDVLDQIDHWIEDPVAMVIECFGVQPDPWQARALRTYRTCRRLALQACVGPGKTTVLSWIAWNFMLIPGSQTAVLSSSGANVRSGLWKEMAYWRDKSPFFKSTYVMTATRVFVPSTETHDWERHWFCEQRTWAKDADDKMAGVTLQGLHALNVMVLMDESGAMPESLMVAAEGILATQHERAHIVQAGNPTVLYGPLYNAATRDRALWERIQITGDPDDPECSPRTNKKWAAEMIKTYGRDHPYVMVKVLGLFPPSSFNALIGPDEANRAIGRHLSASQYDRAARVIGVDVARYGDDLTVVWPRQGLAAFQPEVFRNAHPDDVAGYVATLVEQWSADAVEVDATGGFGDGVVDSLARIGVTAIRVLFSAKPIESKFYNKRSEMIWLMVEWIKKGGAIAPGEWATMLVEEITTLTYTFRLDKILIEEKEMVKARLGRSPDYSDALACSFAFPVQPRERDILAGIDRVGNFNKAVTEYDPLSRA